MCNEIKLAIVYSRTKNREEIKFYLDQLTKIMEVCQLKSKEINPNYLIDLIECNKEKQQSIEEVNQEHDVKIAKQILSQKSKKQTLNNTTQALKSKPRRQNHRYRNK